MKNILQRDIDVVEPKAVPTNTIFTIEPYRIGSIYAFDVPEWDVIAEAFVGGAETFLEKLSGNANRMTAMFSSKPFPGAHKIDYVEGDGFGGTYYYSEELDHKLWLCSFLHKFYQVSPKHIYVSVKPIK